MTDEIAPDEPSSPAAGSVIVSLGDLYADSCATCGERAEWGLAGQKGPEGCVEAVKSGRVYCREHLPPNTVISDLTHNQTGTKA
jgi:hypothetical protein